jgi:N-acylglucosamine-6-phosphate 2-epimerase
LVTNRLQSEVAIHPAILAIQGGLIVSCQASDGTPMNTPEFITAQALTVESAGAKAIRAQGIENVSSIVRAVKVPVIGLVKSYTPDSDVYITPTVEDVLALVAAGADIVAVDATQRSRQKGVSLETFYSQVRKSTSVPLLADIDCLENALYAQSLGFDAVATTLNGYTPSPSSGLPNVDLVKSITTQVNVPVIAEGGYTTPEQVHQAIENGAWAVCVGTAITNPFLMAKYFIKEGF